MSLTTRVTALTPQRVLIQARDLGAHDECIEADWEGACNKCRAILNQAFDVFYGDSENSDEALMRIINDILEDRSKN